MGYTAAHGDPHEAAARSIASMPIGQGGLRLRSIQLLRPAAHWAAWADILPIFAERVLELLARVQPDLDRQQSRVPCVAAALAAERAITNDHFTENPSWRQLLDGERPPQLPPDAEPGSWPHGWQYHASSGLLTQHREGVVLPRSHGRPRTGPVTERSPRGGVPRRASDV